MCGFPIYEYDHIVPYNEVVEHKPENLVLLCPTHHAEKTRGLLTGERVAQVRKAPANRRAGESPPHLLRYGGRQCSATIGSNVHVWPVLAEGMFTVPLLIDDTPIVLFRAEDEQLLLTIQLTDRENRLLVQIVDNELFYSTAPYDAEFVGSVLTVRSEPRAVFVRVEFNPPSDVTISSARIFRNGIEVDVSPGE